MSRTPPASEEAEAQFLGACMTPRLRTARRAVGLVAADDFYWPEHRAIFAAVYVLADGPAEVDPDSVAAWMTAKGTLPRGGRRRLRELMADSSGTADVATWAAIIVERARLRRAIKLGEDIAAAAWATDSAALDALLTDAPGAVAAGVEHPERDDLDDLDALAVAEEAAPTRPWVIDQLLRSTETVVLTGGEGHGKMTLLRQIGVCVASGLHPFTQLASLAPARVLVVDFQEDRVDLARELRPLRRAAGDAYVRGNFSSYCAPAGMNLMAPRDFRTVESLLADTRPALVVMGPLVRMFRGEAGRGRYDEDLVDDLTDRLDELRARYGCALMIEAHVGNDRGSDPESWRVRGSSVFRSWPFFGFGMRPVKGPRREAEFVRWRGDRHAGRPWPTSLHQGQTWPWDPDAGTYDRLLAGDGLGDAGDVLDGPW